MAQALEQLAIDGGPKAIRAMLGRDRDAAAFHHANERRAHIFTILGALGRESPEVSSWDYVLATGRMTPKTPPSSS